jgi:hypothetical protein
VLAIQFEFADEAHRGRHDCLLGDLGQLEVGLLLLLESCSGAIRLRLKKALSMTISSAGPAECLCNFRFRNSRRDAHSRDYFPYRIGVCAENAAGVCNSTKRQPSDDDAID